MGPGPCLNFVTVCISASLDEQTSADLFNRGRPKYSMTCHGTAELLCIYSHQELGDSGRSRRSSGIHVSGKTGWYRFSVLVVSDGRLCGGDNWMVERRDLAGITVRRFLLLSLTTLSRLDLVIGQEMSVSVTQ